MIVDDHRVVRDGLAAVLTALSGGNVRVDASTGNADAALAMASTRDLDVVLIDLVSPTETDPDLVAAMHAIDPDLPIVVVSPEDDVEAVLDFLEAGAVGFVPRLDDPHAVLGAIELAVAGGAVVPPPVLRQLLRGRVGEVIELDLSEDDTELWRLVISGRTMDDIAEARLVSPRTAKRQVARLYAKLGVPGRLGAAELAGRVGLTHVPDENGAATAPSGRDEGRP